MKFERFARGAHAVSCLFLVAGLAACGERISDTRAKAPTPEKASPSAVVIGTAPAEPTRDPAGTAPVAPNTSDLTKSVESQSTPLPGQANDHSNLARKPSQKADEIATTPAEGKASNSGERTK